MKTNRQAAPIERDQSMNVHRKTATVVGVFYILASASAIAALLLFQPILSGPNYLVNGFANQNQVILGVFMELILVITAIGTAVGLFPYVKKHNESIALGFIFFRFLEAIAIMVGIVAVLSLLALSREFTAAAASNASAYQAAGTAIKAVKDWTFIFGPHLFLGINTILYSYLLYKTRLVPRWLAIWGLSGAAIMFIVALFEISGGIPPSWVAPLAMPIAIFEMALAVWLIAKGFNLSAIAASPGKMKTKELLSAA
jgi:hypothetical protein